MLEILKLLLFAEAVTLSPVIADIGKTEVAFKAPKTLVALNQGAFVSIKVSSVVPVTDAVETMRRTEAAFPAGCIQAAGVRPDGSSTRLARQSVATTAVAAFVHLRQEGGARLDAEFISIVISACRTIPGASVTWHNSSK